jgi:diaminohydroxyphosphoribosylaminopyrimidine deaminase/5-amino-6-(5-phosphoribosylamino)uracil reductase
VIATAATDADRRWMAVAIDVSRNCPPVPNAYSVGAVLVDANGQEIARGWSRDTDSQVHAEESILTRIPADDPRLPSATLYSTLEPCAQRSSRHRTCTDLILGTPIPRVVTAWREPSLFVADARGAEVLAEAGRTVIELDDMTGQAMAVNAHLFEENPE